MARRVIGTVGHRVTVNHAGAVVEPVLVIMHDDEPMPRDRKQCYRLASRCPNCPADPDVIDAKERAKGREHPPTVDWFKIHGGK